jgi:hypothetical protein
MNAARHAVCQHRPVGPAGSSPIPLRQGVLAAALGGLLCAAALLPEARAAEYTVAPDIRVGAHFNDNIRLRETNEIEVLGGRAELGLLTRWRTETSEILLRPRVRVSRYDEEIEDSEDYYFDFSALSEGERSRWSVVGNAAREQIVRGQRIEFDIIDRLEDPDLGEFGRIDVQRRRSYFRVAPSFSYEVTERAEAGIGLGYRDVRYSPQLPGEALDFTDARAETFFTYWLTPLSRFRTTAFVSRFEADAIGNDSTTYGLRGRYEVDLTETYRVHVDVGGQRTEIEAGDGAVDDSATGFLFDAGVRRQLERTEIRLSGGRSIQPSGRGFLRETDRIQLALHHQFLPRWYGELAGRAQRSDVVGDGPGANARDSLDIRALFGHQLAPEWNLEASYVFRHQDYEDTPGSASANEAFLTVNYQPRGRVWSR